MILRGGGVFVDAAECAALYEALLDAQHAGLLAPIADPAVADIAHVGRIHAHRPRASTSARAPVALPPRLWTVKELADATGLRTDSIRLHARTGTSLIGFHQGRDWLFEDRHANQFIRAREST